MWKINHIYEMVLVSVKYVWWVFKNDLYYLRSTAPEIKHNAMTPLENTATLSGCTAQA